MDVDVGGGVSGGGHITQQPPYRKKSSGEKNHLAKYLWLKYTLAQVSVKCLQLKSIMRETLYSMGYK